MKMNFKTALFLAVLMAFFFILSSCANVSGGDDFYEEPAASAPSVTERARYTVNGGTGTMSQQSFTYGTAKALTQNAFTRTDYDFLGWSTSSTATTATYTDKQTVNNLSSTNGATVTLYAVWESLHMRIELKKGRSFSNVLKDLGAADGTATAFKKSNSAPTVTISQWLDDGMKIPA